jgi:O-antigen/teichoic acid export membrane protein
MAKGNSSNTQQAFWVGIGSLFSFGFSLVSSMILSRYFLKEDYGTYKQVLYVYHTLLTVFTLGLPRAYAYFLPRVPLNEAKSLINKLTRLFLLLGGVFSVLLYVFSPQIALFMKNPDLELALKIFSPVPLLMFPTMGLEGILSTYRRTQFLTVYTISTRIFMLLCVALPVIFFKGDYLQAIIGFVIASFLSCLLALYLKYVPIKKEGKNKTKVTYHEVLRFSLPLMRASLWGILFTSVSQFFISRYFGTEVFAEFANGSLELPFVGMVVGACSIVLTPVFSKLSHEKLNPRQEIFPLWISAFDKTAKIIYPLVLYCWFFADVLMIVLYGGQYENSASYFRIKSLINFFTLISYAPLIIAIGKTKSYARVLMVGALSLTILEYISIMAFKSPYLITWLETLCRMGNIFMMLWIIANYFEVRIYELFSVKLLLKIALPSAVILSSLHYLLVDVIMMNRLLILVIGFIVYLTVFYPVSRLLKIDYLPVVKPLLAKIRR